MEERNTKEQSDQPNSNAFSTDMRGKCFTCGKPGHRQIECQRSLPQQGRGRGHGRGQNRGIYQHNQRDYNRGHHRGGYNRGRSNNRGTSSSSWNQQGQHSVNSNVFITEVNVSQTDCEKNTINRENKVNWILDSGCTDHVVNDDTIFDKYVVLKKPIDVKLGDGRILKATKIGNIRTTFQIGAKDSEITLYNVFYVKEMKQNLISYSKVTERNKIVSYGNNSKIYNKYKELIAIGKKEGNLYHMSSFVFNAQNIEVSANLTKGDKMTLKEKWHRALGHVNFHYLNKLCKDKLLVGLPKELESDYIKCAICVESKMTNLPFENNRSRAKEILEVIHTDINGPHPTVGNRGEKYFLTFI